MSAPLTSPLGGDDLAKVLRDAYGRGFSQSGEGYNGEYPGDTHEKPSFKNDRDAWIRQYMARLPATDPITTASNPRVGRTLDDIAAAYEARVAAVPEAARRFAAETWGETWSHAEMGSLLDFAALIASAPAPEAGAGGSWLSMKDAPTGVPIIAKHKPNAAMPHGWVATIKLGHGDDEEAGCYDTILHYNGEESFRGFRGMWTGWLPIGSALPSGSESDDREAEYLRGRLQHYIDEAQRLALLVRSLGGDPEPSIGLSPEAGAGGNLGELERLSAKATPGPWRHIAGDDYFIESDSYPPKATHNPCVVDSGWWLAVGNRPNDFGEANSQFIVALVNAYRSGKLVAPTGSEEETKGADQ